MFRLFLQRAQIYALGELHHVAGRQAARAAMHTECVRSHEAVSVLDPGGQGQESVHLQIFAAAELLGDSPSEPFATIVPENGVDFLKLSGNSKAGGVQNVIVLTNSSRRQSTGAGSGTRARTAIMGDSGIGSVYSPESEELSATKQLVETVVEIE
ncbi:hypothetical protein B0H11DRAFT_1931991 [Mycena galericulata]|nr:hypothetical protein B0H11DRAFT_1931991 [Mycena galericulata]